MLVAAQAKYGKLVQMGTQQRSSPHTIEIVDRIHSKIQNDADAMKHWDREYEKGWAPHL